MSEKEETIKAALDKLHSSTVNITLDPVELAFLGKHLGSYLEKAHPKVKEGLESGRLSKKDIVVHETANLISIYEKLGEQTEVLDEFNRVVSDVK